MYILFSMINLPWSFAHWKLWFSINALVSMHTCICTSRQQCDSFSLLTMTTKKIYTGLYHDFYSNYFLKHIKHDTCSRKLWVFAGYRTNYNLWRQFLNSNIYRYRDSEGGCKCSKIGVRRNHILELTFGSNMASIPKMPSWVWSNSDPSLDLTRSTHALTLALLSYIICSRTGTSWTSSHTPKRSAKVISSPHRYKLFLRKYWSSSLTISATFFR